MKIKYILFYLFTPSFILCVPACQESEWLDISNDKALVIPTTLEDLQAILDNESTMNLSYPVLGEMGTDNTYIPEANFIPLTGVERNVYVWSEDLYQGRSSVTDWNQPYKIIASSNIVLDKVNSMDIKQEEARVGNRIKGSALFFRAFAFYNLAQLFCKPYNQSTASSDPGIPLRLTADVNIKVARASVRDTYSQILQDLQSAETLLPADEQYITRPSKAAVMALMAKVYLLMQDYENALIYAGKALQVKSSLLDFKTLSGTSSSPFPAVTNGTTTNTELIFYARCIIYNSLRARGTISKMDTTFIKQYTGNDLRKAVFYTKSGNYWVFKGTYSGGTSTALFAGLATNELYLIRAECNARLNNLPAALADLNSLLEKRYPIGFIPLVAHDSESALNLILQERRKELPLTSQVRWEDLRRLNMEPKYAVTLARKFAETQYTLLPGDNRYVLPIPDYEINLNPMPQNER